MDKLQKIQEAKSELKNRIELSIRNFNSETEGLGVFLNDISISINKLCEIGVGQVGIEYEVNIEVKI